MKEIVSTKLPTKFGQFDVYAYSNVESDAYPHLAFVNISSQQDLGPLVRIHSECLTGDIFSSLKCDCGDQLNKALELIADQGGILIYLRQEGRGIGLINKLKAYNLQDAGMDTVEANIHLGFEPDQREFKIAIDILKSLDISSIRLLTNNPEKITAIEDSEITLIDRVPLEIQPHEGNHKYLSDKKDKMGHLLKL